MDDFSKFGDFHSDCLKIDGFIRTHGTPCNWAPDSSHAIPPDKCGHQVLSSDPSDQGSYPLLWSDPDPDLFQIYLLSL